MNHAVQAGARKLSTHYYVLSLEQGTTQLYEAFRDSLIDIQNTWFPLVNATGPAQPDMSDAQLRTLLERVDLHFARYLEHEPLGVVVVGSERFQSAFASMTSHSDLIIGYAKGDDSSTSVNVLGGIVWPIVKEAMAIAGQRAARELEVADRAENVAAGIDAVVRAVDAGVGTTLWVEDGYLVKPEESSPLIEDFDNIVDHVIEKVLALGGNVLFARDGSLSQFLQIALILRAEAVTTPQV